MGTFTAIYVQGQDGIRLIATDHIYSVIHATFTNRLLYADIVRATDEIYIVVIEERPGPEDTRIGIITYKLDEDKWLPKVAVNTTGEIVGYFVLSRKKVFWILVTLRWPGILKTLTMSRWMPEQ